MANRVGATKELGPTPDLEESLKKRSSVLIRPLELSYRIFWPQFREKCLSVLWHVDVVIV